ncbi:Uncharacterised protein [Mycobacteroides abscessus subsp. abscessus]|nr:Uncharacterised protein [Mycobacteroides abscessus subsp. abscessus]SKV43606.1 Uncharacterised protein [Mycobacteroides abscessus subsp. abscessus]
MLEAGIFTGELIRRTALTLSWVTLTDSTRPIGAPWNITSCWGSRPPDSARCTVTRYEGANGLIRSPPTRM